MQRVRLARPVWPTRACFASITTTETGSVVYGTWSDGNEDVPSPYDANTTLLTTADNAPVGDTYGTFRSTSPTGTPGAVRLVCFRLTLLFRKRLLRQKSCLMALLPKMRHHPLAFMTIQQMPLLQHHLPLRPVRCWWLSLMVAEQLGSFAVTDSSGLTWTQLVTEQGFPYFTAGIWVADVPGGGSTPSGTVQPKATVSTPRRKAARAVTQHIRGSAPSGITYNTGATASANNATSVNITIPSGVLTN